MRGWVAAVGSGGLCGLAFAPVGWWWTLLFAPALWLHELRMGAARANAWLGFWWGLALGVVVSWHAAPTVAQEARAEWLGGLAWTLALVWYAGWSALFGWLMGKPGVLVHPIVPRTGQTLYVRLGDWWAYGCLGMAIGALAWDAWQRRRLGKVS